MAQPLYKQHEFQDCAVTIASSFDEYHPVWLLGTATWEISAQGKILTVSK